MPHNSTKAQEITSNASLAILRGAVSNATSSSHNQSYRGSTGNWVGCQTELAMPLSLLSTLCVCVLCILQGTGQVLNTFWASGDYIFI
uniref:Uncharacterized protein n=1 Tax=Knipowitschia caucasica TaxID=637954 RepID=A0AAV2MR69_KNICA